MTTRRGFIKNLIAGVVALVLPKTATHVPTVIHGSAVTAEIDGQPFKLEQGLRIDGKDSWSDFVNPAAKLYGPGYIDWIHFPEYSEELE